MESLHFIEGANPIAAKSGAVIGRGLPAQIRSDNGPLFPAKAVCDWIAVLGVKTALV